ncbi:sporulation/spore germination protein [Almyronema epifaneia]|uniref:Sporulation/spore germination protein n=1 Tax=Almyronema epifaneia S1 TaxID=2991925 RepID=A0ABW6IAM6_9CYAN
MRQANHPFWFLAISLGLLAAGCDRSSQLNRGDRASSTSTANAEATAPSTPADRITAPTAALPTTAKPQTAVTIYRVDSTCSDFVPQVVQVESDQAIEQAISQVLSQEQTGIGFDLAGYRINVETSSGEATIDLRLSPQSQRQLVSLSSCEQLALFGSLRETLLRNPDWNIRSVQFTERGKAIVL